MPTAAPEVRGRKAMRPYYFGCNRRAGHYLYANRDGFLMSDSRQRPITDCPFSAGELDCTFCPAYSKGYSGTPQIEGSAKLASFLS